MVTTNKDLVFFLAKNGCDKPSDQMEVSGLSCSLITIKECFDELYFKSCQIQKSWRIVDHHKIWNHFF